MSTGFKILNAEPDQYSEEARDILLKCGHLHEERCDRKRLLELIPFFDILIVRLGHRIDEEVLIKAHRLRVIVTATTGLNHIDVAGAGKRGIEVLSLKGETSFLQNITATAELTWTLILSLSRRLPEAREQVSNGYWNRDLLKGYELKGKTIGIIGFGRLGKIVAEYAISFRMKVYIHDPYISEVPTNIKKMELNTLLEISDFVTIHVPLTDSTKGFFGQRQFNCMKKGSVFINTSRGELIHENALLMAIESGRIKAAGLDVLSGEIAGGKEWLTNNPLWRYAQEHNNLILTPHIGGATFESMETTELFMAEKLKFFLNEKLE
jgi:D-3-phosphoglycerate dehydrogenase